MTTTVPTHTAPIRATVPTYATTQAEAASRKLFTELNAGDRVEITHEVKVGSQRWMAKTIGTVVRCERRKHGLHFRRNLDDKVYSDVIILTREDGELTTITMDEYTILRRL
jgi:hypothetical protein